jgi:hypothetical protein
MCRSKFLYLLIALMSVCSVIVFGQRPPAPPAPPEHTCPVLLFNNTGRTIQFKWSGDDQKWVDSTIQSQMDSNMCIGGHGHEDDVFFKVSTEKKDGSIVAKHYRLRVGKRYRLFANSDCECWDVSAIEPRK